MTIGSRRRRACSSEPDAGVDGERRTGDEQRLAPWHERARPRGTSRRGRTRRRTRRRASGRRRRRVQSGTTNRSMSLDDHVAVRARARPLPRPRSHGLAASMRAASASRGEDLPAAQAEDPVASRRAARRRARDPAALVQAVDVLGDDAGDAPVGLELGRARGGPSLGSRGGEARASRGGCRPSSAAEARRPTRNCWKVIGVRCGGALAAVVGDPGVGGDAGTGQHSEAAAREELDGLVDGRGQSPASQRGRRVSQAPPILSQSKHPSFPVCFGRLDTAACRCGGTAMRRLMCTTGLPVLAGWCTCSCNASRPRRRRLTDYRA